MQAIKHIYSNKLLYQLGGFLRVDRKSILTADLIVFLRTMSVLMYHWSFFKVIRILDVIYDI